MWSDVYIGIPWGLGVRNSMQSIDCYGLVRLVYRHQFEIELPAYQDATTNSEPSEILRDVAMETSGGKWRKVDKPEDKDVVLFRLIGRPFHCGVVVGETRFLHVMPRGLSCVENLSSPIWRKRIKAFYRHEGRA